MPRKITKAIHVGGTPGIIDLKVLELLAEEAQAMSRESQVMADYIKARHDFVA